MVHIVGGGARNELLCQLTADACGLPVVAGPVEATALGNALVQARALGAVTGDLTRLRGLVRDNVETAFLRAPGQGDRLGSGRDARLLRSLRTGCGLPPPWWRQPAP